LRCPAVDMKSGPQLRCFTDYASSANRFREPYDISPRAPGNCRIRTIDRGYRPIPQDWVIRSRPAGLRLPVMGREPSNDDVQHIGLMSQDENNADDKGTISLSVVTRRDRPSLSSLALTPMIPPGPSDGTEHSPRKWSCHSVLVSGGRRLEIWRCTPSALRARPGLTRSGDPKRRRRSQCRIRSPLTSDCIVTSLGADIERLALQPTLRRRGRFTPRIGERAATLTGGVLHRVPRIRRWCPSGLALAVVGPRRELGLRLSTVQSIRQHAGHPPRKCIRIRTPAGH